MRLALTLFLAAVSLSAATSRIRGIDNRQSTALPNSMHRLAQAQFDLGPADPNMQLDYVQMVFKPAAAQQEELDGLLRDQQNPASPDFHKWLTPEQFGERFGLSSSDRSRVTAWLVSQGLTVQETSRGANWIAFAGPAGRVASALRTSIHSYRVDGRVHYANATPVSVPTALAEVTSGFLGLNDFKPVSMAKPVPIEQPDYNASGRHFLGPADLATIYNVMPLYGAGIDGTGQNVAVVGDSGIDINDIRGFRAFFKLPANDPKLVAVGSAPGITGDQIESNLDIEWAGALAPKATVYYYYGTNVFGAASVAVSQNLVQVISISFGFCELDDEPYTYRTVVQQANAQGITVLNSAGDSGAGGCDIQGNVAVATHGRSVAFPSNLPEITSVGGTMFNEGTGSYWAATNTAAGGSALSYIPEKAWNESSVSFGLGSTGGGPSSLFAKPAWQTGPGVPNDGARDVPDVSLSAAGHDPYLITLGGQLTGVAGTSASAPAMASMLALLNQYQVNKGLQKTAGMGNINPQLYRLARAVPAAFHDVTEGDNKVPCAQGTQDCGTGSFGYAAGTGYDLATGLGSIDANVLVTSWNTATSAVTVTLSSSSATASVGDTLTLTATVAAATGSGTPTGSVTFLYFGIPLGTVDLTASGGHQTAKLTFPVWMLATGNRTLYAQYSGDAGFSAGGASTRIRVTLPADTTVSAVVPRVTNPVYAFQSGTQAPTWQVNILLNELAGVPALLTGFTIDGQAQPLAQYFPSPNIPARGTLNATIVMRNVAVPVVKTFVFTGTDVSGQTWTRQIPVRFLPVHGASLLNVNMWASPLTVQQNPAAPAGCQWSQQITFDETTGYGFQLVALAQGSIDLTARIASLFGTDRLAPWGTLSGALCWNDITPPVTDTVAALFVDTTFGVQIPVQVNVTLTGPPGGPVQLSVSPASVTVKPVVLPNFAPPVTFTINLSDKTQPWTAQVFPGNRTTDWLKLSQYSGTGPATVTVQTSGAGFEPGAYGATILIQSPNAVPQWVSVPVMFVNTPSTSGPAITSVGNALSFTGGASPGMLMAVYGTQLADVTEPAMKLPLGISMGGVTATVNGWPAPLLYVSPTQLNIQVPYEAGAGPAVLGVNNKGQAGGFMFQISPSAPGIFSSNGDLYPTPMAKQGDFVTMYVTGAGEVGPTLDDGFGVAMGTSLGRLPKPLLPLTVTVGGTPALVQFAGATPGTVGLAQVNFVVPVSVPVGAQPVVVTVGGVASAPARITVTAK